MTVDDVHGCASSAVGGASEGGSPAAAAQVAVDPEVIVSFAEAAPQLSTRGPAALSRPVRRRCRCWPRRETLRVRS